MNNKPFVIACNKGFTLIEMLVVVLIVGILAAIALPQYELAVEKARAREGLMMTRSIFKAHELFYLTNGVYADSLDDLDISFPGEEKNSTYVKSKAMRYFECRPHSKEQNFGDMALCQRKDDKYGRYYFICGKDSKKCFCRGNSSDATKKELATKWCEKLTGKTRISLGKVPLD